MRPLRKTALLLVASTSLVLAVSAPAQPVPGSAVPAVAPYLEVTGANPANLDAGLDAGLTQVTAAFVIGDGCVPTWDDGSQVSRNRAVAAAIAGAQSRGAQVVISFGGAGGVDLARSCTRLGRLVAAYQSVIDRFAVTSLDFDVEGEAIDPVKERSSIERRFAAIRALQQANPGLEVSVTIGVGRSGLPQDQMSFLHVAQRTGTSLDLVNLMTMDYGAPVRDMGAAAIRAARKSLAQVQTVWPSATYGDLGITPMIGRNDSARETTTLQDAVAIRDFATDNGVGRLAFWSLNRDQQCGRDKARGNCSGVHQEKLAFTRALLGEGRPASGAR